eukprot:UN01532
MKLKKLESGLENKENVKPLPQPMTNVERKESDKRTPLPESYHGEIYLVKDERIYKLTVSILNHTAVDPGSFQQYDKFLQNHGPGLERLQLMSHLQHLFRRPMLKRIENRNK